MTLVIRNDRLEVQIQEPGSRYKRTRFDWSGICQQIKLDGEHIFCSQEATADNPGTEGVGLIDEFGIHTSIGYDQTAVGDWFPKIGVGFLQKSTNSPYDFFSDYSLNPVPIRVEGSASSKITFLQESEVYNGWGWRLRKTFQLDGPVLTIDYLLENCGDKPLTTEQYNHNFVAVDSQPVGPDYQLDTSFPMHFDLVEGGLLVDNMRLNLTEIPPKFIYALQSNLVEHQDVDWRLSHIHSSHGMLVSERFKLHKFAIWAMSHVISPEFFIWIDLQPGQVQTWQRKYTFF